MHGQIEFNHYQTSGIVPWTLHPIIYCWKIVDKIDSMHFINILVNYIIDIYIITYLLGYCNELNCFILVQIFLSYY